MRVDRDDIWLLGVSALALGLAVGIFAPTGIALLILVALVIGIVCALLFQY